MSLQEQLAKKMTEIKTAARKPINTLEATALQMKQPEIAKRIKGVEDSLMADTFNLIVVGRFKNGKSTFLNTLLTPVTHPVPVVEAHGELLPTDDLAATAVLTRIHYKEHPFVTMWRMNEKKSETWPLDRFWAESKLRTNPKESAKFFEDIGEFEIGYPSRLCQAGVTLIDSPGTGESPIRNVVTQRALRQSDVAFMVFRSDSLMSLEEMNFLAELKTTQTIAHFFFIINLFNDRVLDDRFRETVWYKLMEMEGRDEPYTGQDFTKRDVFFVNCKRALEGVRTANTALIESSGLGLLERHVNDFLQKKKLRLHLERWINQADLEGNELEQVASRSLKSLELERSQFDEILKKIRPLQDKIEGHRQDIKRILERKQKIIGQLALSSYRNLITEIEKKLLETLLAADLPSLQNSGSNWDIIVKRLSTPFTQDKIKKEVEEVAVAFIKKEIVIWQEKTLLKEIESTFEDLRQEIEREVVAIDKNLTQIQVAITGGGIILEGTAAYYGPSTQERLAFVVLGAMTGNLDMALHGGVGGWKAALRGFAVEVGTAVVLMVMGVSVLPAMIIGIVAAIITNAVTIFGESDKIVQSIKKGIAQSIITGDAKKNIPSLRQKMTDAEPDVAKGIDHAFSEISSKVMDVIDGVIQTQKAELSNTIEANLKSAGEKQQLIAERQVQAITIRAQRDALAQVRSTLQQL